MAKTHGGFTLPGESGFERLTLDLAAKWGADCIRDSDGTQLSPEILEAGIPIYSTLCIVRNLNSWAKQNMDKLQRNFLMTDPVLAEGTTLQINPMAGFFDQQFWLCPSDDPKEFWQVFDRTTGVEHGKDQWSYDAETGLVTIENAVPYHLYTVTFLATRIWEEISMYNHVTNDWGDKEHLMAVEPRYPETQEALLNYMEQWLIDHPATNVVRFTSMFYNFCWIWGSDRARHSTLFTDWGSYDFTVNPVSLREFKEKYGYAMTGEDFVNAGRYHPTHNPPCQKQRDWMEFTGEFVRSFGKKLIDLTHKYGKKAYVFYDDSWVGIEPWNGKFGEFGFDGLIKCVFNAFEARLCAGVKDVPIHELRLHPYLFPTGLTGDPTFAPGGHPDADARRYWACVRRALLRAKIDRIGLGGYLHLTEPFPEFNDAIEAIADEFRLIRSFHEAGEAWESGVRVAVLHSWGSLRTWNCAGHMHEHPDLPLNHLNEAMAGLPISLRAISFEDVINGGVPADVDVVINAGFRGDAWSGGDVWLDARLQEELQKFIAKGGALLGVAEPTAADGAMRYFQLADMLGVEREIGQTNCAEKYKHEVAPHFISADGVSEVAFHNARGSIYALDGKTTVVAADETGIRVAAREVGQGRTVYMNGFTYSPENARLLYRALLWAAKKEEAADTFLPTNPACECAYYPDARQLVVINNTPEEATTQVATPWGVLDLTIEGEGIAVLEAK